MGLGQLFTRNVVYDVTNTVTGETGSYTIITDGGPGMFPAWSNGEYRGAMGIPAAWRLALLIANQLGRIPWQGYRVIGDLPPERIKPDPPLLAAPTAGMEVPLSTWRAFALDRLWHGNAIALIAARSPLGWPTALLPVSAEWVQVKRARGADNDLGFAEGEIIYLINGKRYRQADVMHVKGPSKPGDLRGMGVLETHFDLIDRSRNLDRSAGGVTSSGVPTGLLESLNPDITQTEADELKASWTTAQQTRTVAVLNPSTKFTPIAWNPTETQLLESRTYSLVEWANVFGAPVSYVNGQNASRIYSNLEDQGTELLKFGTVGDVIAEFEQTLSFHMPRGTYVKANLDHLLRANTKMRYEAHAIALAAGFLTADEVREFEERPPLTAAQRAEIAQSKASAAQTPGARPGQGAVAASNQPGTGAAPARLAAVRADSEPDDLDAELPLDLSWGWESHVLGDDEIVSVPDDFGERAADLTGRRLREYWTRGPGLAKWASSPTPWRTLHKLLSEFLSGDKLDSTTSSWYRIVFGKLPGRK